GHLAAAIGLFVVLEYLFLQTEASIRFTMWAFGGGINWLIVLGLFMGTGWLFDKWARSETSRTMQYLGLGLSIVAHTIVYAPLLIFAMLKTGDGTIIAQAGVITLTVFAGLTGTVFITRKDFSFLGGALSIGAMAAFGVIIAAIVFGFTLGTIFSVLMVALMAGYILFYTSRIVGYFRPTQYVSAAALLFSCISTLFWYVLSLLTSLTGD
ncbi:MAG: Bax inhibitor-1 family protein, partial [Myxococcota bacterium]